MPDLKERLTELLAKAKRAEIVRIETRDKFDHDYSLEAELEVGSTQGAAETAYDELADAAVEALPALLARIEALEKVLEPFAAAADQALAQFDKPVTLAALNRVAQYFTEWTHYQSARQLLSQPHTSGEQG